MIPVVDVVIGFLQEQTAEASSIEWTPSAIILLSVIGLAVLVQLFHLIKGDALSPPTVEADEQAAGPSSADVPTDTPVSMPDAEGLSDTDAVELGIQSWRLQKRVNLLPLQDHPKHKRRLDDSVSQINRLLQKCRIEVEDPIGQIYTDGWVAVEVASAEIIEPWPNDSDPRPFVHETIRPIIRRDGQMLKTGQVIIGEQG